MNIGLHRRRGFSLVEMMIGVTILIFVIAGGFLALKSLSRAVVHNVMRMKADRKLQSVADQLRQESISNFFTLTSGDRTCPPGYETNPSVLCPESEQRIRVTAVIPAIDPATRTRDVELTARWKDSTVETVGQPERIRKFRFFLSQNRGQLAGGKITLKVVYGNLGVGVPGVKVWAQGESSEKTSQLTGSDGVVELTGIKLPVPATSNIPIYLDATNLGYFSLGPPNTPYMGLWVSTITAVGIRTNAVVDLGTHTLWELGVVKGRVVDFATSTGAVNVHVALLSISSTMVRPTEIAETKVTDDNGEFVFTGVIPGKYSIHTLGSKNGGWYAAVAQKDDDYQARRQQFSVLSTNHISNPIVFNATSGAYKRLETVKRGHISASVRGINFDTAGVPTLPYLTPTGSTSLLMSEREAYIGWSGEASYTLLDKTVPFARYEWVQDFPSGDQKLTMPNAPFTSTAYYVAPNIVQISTRSGKDWTYEYGWVDMQADRSSPSNLTPILVYPGTDLFSSSARITHPDSTDDYMPMSKYQNLGSRASVTDKFLVKVPVDQTVAVTANYLGRTSLSSVSGKIYWSNPTRQLFPVSKWYGTGGWNAVLVRNHYGGWYSWRYPMFDHKAGTMSADPYASYYDNSGTSYDFLRSAGGQRGLVPSFGADTSAARLDQVQVRAESVTATWPTFPIDIKVIGFTRKKTGGSVITSTSTVFPATGFPGLNGMYVNYYIPYASNPLDVYFDDGSPTIGSPTPISAAPTTVNHGMSEETRYIGYSDDFVLMPGRSYTKDIDVVAETTWAQLMVGLAAGTNTNWVFNPPADPWEKGYIFDYCSATPLWGRPCTVGHYFANTAQGAYQAYLPILRKTQIDRITVSVTNTNTAGPLLGATVEIYVPDNGTFTGTTGADGKYVLTNKTIILKSFELVRVTVKYGSVTPVSQSLTPTYENMTESANIGIYIPPGL